jgi:transposase
MDEKGGVSLGITGGQDSDMPGFDKVFDPLPQEHALEAAIMAKGYDRNHIRDKLRKQGLTPVIPPKSNRKETIGYDKELYKLREKVERFFNKLKQFRRIATRYEKLGYMFLAFIHIVASCVIVK